MRMNDFEYRLIPGGAEITGYYGSAGQVVFPDEIDGQPLIALGRCALVTNMVMEEIVIPDSVTLIGFGAFEGCLRLRSVRFPARLEKIGFRAFARCESLTEAILPDDLTILEEGVFNGCASLSALRLPAGVKVIRRNAFLGCNGLKEIAVPEGVERIEAQAFSGCGGALSLTLPSTVREIGSDAFQGCGRLESFHVPQAFQPFLRDLRVGYGLMLQDSQVVVGSFTYMLLRGQAILEDYEGPGTELTIPAFIEGHPVGGVNHTLFLNLSGLEKISLPRSLAGAADSIPAGVEILWRD